MGEEEHEVVKAETLNAERALASLEKNGAALTGMANGKSSSELGTTGEALTGIANGKS